MSKALNEMTMYAAVIQFQSHSTPFPDPTECKNNWNNFYRYLWLCLYSNWDHLSIYLSWWTMAHWNEPSTNKEQDKKIPINAALHQHTNNRAYYKKIVSPAILFLVSFFLSLFPEKNVYKYNFRENDPMQMICIAYVYAIFSIRIGSFCALCIMIYGAQKSYIFIRTRIKLLELFMIEVLTLHTYRRSVPYAMKHEHDRQNKIYINRIYMPTWFDFRRIHYYLYVFFKKSQNYYEPNLFHSFMPWLVQPRRKIIKRQ